MSIYRIHKKTIHLHGSLHNKYRKNKFAHNQENRYSVE